MEIVEDNLARGLELQNQGRADEADAMFRRLLQRTPGDLGAAYSLAVLCVQRGRPDEALQFVGPVVLGRPDFRPGWFARAMALQALGRHEEALLNFDCAAEGDTPTRVEALNNKACLLREMGRHADAVAALQSLLATHPRSARALSNQGILLGDFKQHERAAARFERVLAIEPDFPYGPGLHLFAKMHACDWRGFEDERAALVQAVREGRRACKSMAFIAMCDSAADQQQCARIYAADAHPHRPEPLWRGPRQPRERLRVAYVSPDLRQHPVGHLMAGVFEQHDRSRVEIVGISLGIDDGSDTRRRIRAACDEFHDVRTLPARQVAELMRSLEIDVAVDLAGYTADSRTDIFLHRPAPVQVNYLGYPGTMGLDCMDWILADDTVIPPEHEPFYDERVMRLPGTYLPADPTVVPSPDTPSREALGLPPDAFVFCSFNHDYKLNPPVWDVWMDLLRQVDGSVLWLMKLHEAAERNLRLAAEVRGIDPARLVFAGRVPRIEDHLARYRAADLFLDTTPYNAHTTAVDALRAGLPVVTMLGNAFASRVAASVLRSLGLDELVTADLPAYERAALALARSPDALQALRQRVRQAAGAPGAFDARRRAAELEDAFRAMFEAA